MLHITVGESELKIPLSSESGCSDHRLTKGQTGRDGILYIGFRYTACGQRICKSSFLSEMKTTLCADLLNNR